MRVALVHDYLREYGGAERVLEALHEIWPEAPLYTAFYYPPGLGIHAGKFKNWDIRSSWLQYLPFANKLISPMRIFAPQIFESFDLSDYDLVISSSSAVYFAKAVLTKPETLHISYIHTPPRFLYGYVTSFNYKKHLLTRIGGEVMNSLLRIKDFQISQRPDILVANSENVRARIKKFYRRDSMVIYPPVEVEQYQVSSIKYKGKKQYFLSLGRLVRGKGTEVVVAACTQLGLPLKVVGSGPERENLQRLAGKNVQFLGNVSDEERVKLLAGAKALIVASIDEDFGLTPVEAEACGTPVIALKAGGYLETVVEGKTGQFFNEPTVESLMKILKDFNLRVYGKEDLQKNAQQFSKERFKREILKLVEENLKN